MKGILALVGKIAGAIIVVGTAGGVLWAVFSYTNNIEDHNEDIKEELTQHGRVLNYLVKNDSIRCMESDTILRSLERINNNMNNLQGDFSALRSTYVHERSEVLTPQEFLRLMDELGLTDNIKKNSQKGIAETVSED